MFPEYTQGHMQAHTQYMPAHAQSPAAGLSRGLSLAKRQTRFLFVFGMNERGSFLVLCFNTPELGASSSWPVRSRGVRVIFQGPPAPLSTRWTAGTRLVRCTPPPPNSCPLSLKYSAGWCSSPLLAKPGGTQLLLPCPPPQNHNPVSCCILASLHVVL